MNKKTLPLMAILILLVGSGGIIRPRKKLDMQYAVRLRSRTFVPAQRVERELPAYFKEQARLKRVHVLVQFEEVPSLRDRKNLEEKMQLRVLDPVPERAFFASIPTDISVAKTLVDKKLVRWIGKIHAKDKVSPLLLKEGVPAHARRDKDRAELIVQFFGDVGVSSQKQTLKRHGAELITRIVPLNGWRLIVDEARILSLAGEDGVKWIVEVPEPPVECNDLVRSDTGVNAEPLHAPAGYNLSGAGITVAQWEPRHASFGHDDYSARVTLGDSPLPRWDRSIAHDESVTANGQFDNGEGIYWDIDDSGDVSAGDVRATTVGGLAPGNVAAGNGDVGIGLIPFIQYNSSAPAPYEGFSDTPTVDGLYTEGDGIFLDNDLSARVSDGDTRLTPVGTYAAGSVVSGGSAGPPVVPADTDVGDQIWFLSDAPHSHATHVAGTVLGDGSRSLASGGSANQWKGVAPGVNLRSYSGDPTNATGAPIGTDEYVDAANNNVSISSNSWRTGRSNAVSHPDDCYDVGSQYYDAVVSGRQSDGTPSGLTRPILIVTAAGNDGRYPERYVDNNLNGLFDNGEPVYRDNDDSGTVTNGDIDLIGVAVIGTVLENFTANEMHEESDPSFRGYKAGEGIYIDTDSSRTVTTDDARITAPAGSVYADDSAVATGDTDIDNSLTWFRPYGGLAVLNSGKNTLEVASIGSDTQDLSVFSSRGLTYDGRFKPDISGPGSEDFGDFGVTSTVPGNGYGIKQGTSMATPALSGCAALLEEWYKTACSAGGPGPEIIKALLIHSCQDLTDIPNVGTGFVGPDFAFGYGRARAKEAVELMPHYMQGTAAALGSTPYTFTTGAMDTLKVTLVWNDPPWIGNTTPAAATGLLQNDLDLLLIGPDGTQYTPWVADSANLFAPATRSVIVAGNPVPVSAEDHRNNVEQVVVDNAGAGTWTIRVTASGLNLPPQDYVIVSEMLPPNTTDCTANAAADVWVKDNPTDDGTVPSTGAMYLGADIWNRLAADGLTAHENPEFGQTNFLYANIRNKSAVEVKSTVIDAWISTLAIGLVWPDGFVHVGRFNIPNLGPGEVRQVGPLEWEPKEVGHKCMYTRVSSPQDPITFAETSNVWTNANNSNNIAYKNMTIVDLASSKSVSFLVRNIQKDDADVDIVIDIPEKLLKVGEVQMMLSPELERQWPLKNRKVEGLAPLKGRYYMTSDFDIPEGIMTKPSVRAPMETEMQKTKMGLQGLQGLQRTARLPIYKFGAKNTVLKGFHMEPRQADRMTLTFSSKQTTKAVYHIHVTQKVKGETIGGILFIVRTGYGKNE